METALIELIIDRIRRGDSSKIENILTTIETAILLDKTKTKFYAHSIGLNGNGEVRLGDFIDFIARHIIEYVIPRSRIEEAKKKDEKEGLTTNTMRLAYEAQKLFTPLEKTGEGGEMLLFILGEVLLGYPQLFCKMSVKTAGEVHYHGADGIHVGFRDGKIDLYWGESKFHKAFRSALNDCIKSIGPILKRIDDADHEDLLLLQTYLDLNNEQHTDVIKAILDRNGSEFKNVRYCGICLIGFNENVYSSSFSKEELDKVCGVWRREMGRKLSSSLLHSYDIHFFCLPLPCVDDFRRKFLQRMGITTYPKKKRKSRKSGKKTMDAA